VHNLPVPPAWQQVVVLVLVLPFGVRQAPQALHQRVLEISNQLTAPAPPPAPAQPVQLHTYRPALQHLKALWPTPGQPTMPHPTLPQPMLSLVVKQVELEVWVLQQQQ
jgi:hypothetical protein